MEKFAAEFRPPDIDPFTVIVARLLLACDFGAAIGFEREWRNRPAGLRTHILVCVAAALSQCSRSRLRMPRFPGRATTG